MERLTVDDAAFLNLEDQVSAMHGATVAVFDAPEPAFADLVREMGTRVGVVPRLRQRVIDVPGHLERPVWVDDPHFSIDYHLRHSAVPADSDIEGLRKLIGRLLSQRLDRGKPLWELWMVSGLDAGRWAIVSKTHHSMLDGVSGTDPLSLVVDQSRRSVTSEGWAPRPIPTDGELLARAATDLVFDPRQQIRLARRAFVKPVTRTVSTVLGARPLSNPKGLVGAVSSHRRWASLDLKRPAVRSARDRLQVSTNDVLLGLTSAGFRAMLASGSAPLPSTMRTLVPLAVATGELFTNEISALTAELPVAESDIDQAIEIISAQSVGTHRRDRPVAGKTLAGLKGLNAPTLSALGLRQATRTGLRSKGIETVMVNAPGPDETMTVLGIPMVALYPAIPLVAKVRISVGVMSYRDSFYFGVTGDDDTDLEIGELLRGIESAADTLLQRAEG